MNKRNDDVGEFTLKSCPFCGSNTIKLDYYDRYISSYAFNPSFASINCENCGANLRIENKCICKERDIKILAITKWNTRA